MLLNYRKLILLALWCLWASNGEAFSAGNKSPEQRSSLLLDSSSIRSQRPLCNKRHHGLCLDGGDDKSTLPLTALQMNSLSSSGGAQEDVPLPSKIRAFAKKNSFLLGMAMAVSFARAFPSVSLF